LARLFSSIFTEKVKRRWRLAARCDIGAEGSAVMGCDWMSEVMKVQLVNHCTDPRHIKCLRTFTVSCIRLVSRVQDSRALREEGINEGNRQKHCMESKHPPSGVIKAGPLRATTESGIASPDVQTLQTRARPTRPMMRVPVCDSGASCIDLNL
jgi:hypothetical protein